LKWLALSIMCLFGAFLFYVEVDMPEYGDPEAAANLHVSPYYIHESFQETGTPNIVTAILADYRAYDTLGETIVIFTAGLACLLLLGRSKRDDSKVQGPHR